MAENLEYTITQDTFVSKTGKATDVYVVSFVDRIAKESWSGAFKYLKDNKDKFGFWFYDFNKKGFLFFKDPTEFAEDWNASGYFRGEIESSGEKKAKTFEKSTPKATEKLPPIPDKSEWASLEKVYFNTKETATLIREALKREFPEIKFSVRSKVYSGGSSIRVSYVDGVQQERVDKIARYFQGSTFNGMIDMKESNPAIPVWHNGKWVLGDMGADYVFVSREFSSKYCRYLDWGLDLTTPPTLKEQVEYFAENYERQRNREGYSLVEKDGSFVVEITGGFVSSHDIELVGSCMKEQGVKVTVEQYKVGKGIDESRFTFTPISGNVQPNPMSEPTQEKSPEQSKALELLKIKMKIQKQRLQLLAKAK